MKKLAMEGISKMTALAAVAIAASFLFFFFTMDKDYLYSLTGSLFPQFTLSFAASIAASSVFVRTMAKDLLPSRFQDYLSSLLNSLIGRLSSELTVYVDEYNGPIANPIYRSVETYLSTKLPHSTSRLHVTKSEDSEKIHVSMHKGEEVVEFFNSVRFAWRFTSRKSSEQQQTRYDPQRPNSGGGFTVTKTKAFELTFQKKHKSLAIDSYLPYVIKSAESIRQESKSLTLCTNNPAWTAANMTHPVTFDKLAMEEGMKREVMEDLKKFVSRKEYYKRVGKAWKRGYLLYGPPGTGKSSLVAAMANYLRFDVYDLQLTEVRSNWELRLLLSGIAKRSILVIEDIDCSANFITRELDAGRRKKEEKSTGGDTEVLEGKQKVTLSGLLNSVDGLWSSCADERIIVFTTNHKERLDPALLRPGRMDMHIHMSYCTPSGFRVLASNYHCVDEDHPLFEEIEGLIGEVEVTPAVVAEELLKNEDAEVALRGLIRFLQRSKEEKKPKE